MNSFLETFVSIFFLGPLCSVLVERFGCRVTVMVGGVLSGLGMAVSALARTITELYITGVITGQGPHSSVKPYFLSPMHSEVSSETLLSLPQAWDSVFPSSHQ